MRSLADGDFVPMELIKDDYARMADLVEQYADLPLGTSDASVIALAERLGIPEVATLDLCCGTTIDSEAAPPQVRAHVDHQQQLTKTPETKSEGSGVSHLIFDGSRC